MTAAWNATTRIPKADTALSLGKPTHKCKTQQKGERPLFQWRHSGGHLARYDTPKGTKWHQRLPTCAKKCNPCHGPKGSRVNLQDTPKRQTQKVKYAGPREAHQRPKHDPGRLQSAANLEKKRLPSIVSGESRECTICIAFRKQRTSQHTKKRHTKTPRRQQRIQHRAYSNHTKGNTTTQTGN